MNHYQDQTKKKPLIQYHKMSNYNKTTLVIKDKVKKQKSVQKQNICETQNKKFKDFNLSKYGNQYQTENNIQIFKKPNPTSQGISLAPSNIQVSSNIPNKNLTFGIVKNNQKNHMTQINQSSTEPDIQQNNPIISVNVNIQNVSPNIIDFKKNAPKYQIKPTNFKRNPQVQNQRGIFQHERPPLKIDENQKRKFNSTTINATQRFMQRTSILQRTTIERTNQRIDKKQKFKKQFQQKYIKGTSPIVDKDFMCEEELDIKPIEKKPLLYEKKLSQKKLQILQISQNTNQMTSNQMSAVINPPNALVNQQRYVKKPQKIDRKIQQKELKQFEAKQEEINAIYGSEAINVLFEQQQKYRIDPTYLQKTQKNINWTVRAILIDWMRQLSHQYSLKRDTYHLAVVFLDNYLAKKLNIQKQAAQVIGATTLFIASKLEELECRPSQSFAESTQGICSAKDIQTLQIQICKMLQFNLNPPTICSLANRIMKQWDSYIDEIDYAMHHPCFQNKEKPYFKKLDNNSYKHFRQLMQYIDCVILDIQTAQYKPLLIVLSLIYLIIGIKVAGFQNEEIYQMFPRVSHYLLDRSNYFNDLFQNFVSSTFGMTLLEILPSVQYTASYFNLVLSFEKPVLGEDEQDLEQMELQEYCSYQTYNRHMLKIVTSRFRGIMNTF